MNLLFETNVPPIDGLHYIRDFISAEEEVVLLQHIDSPEWLNDLKRRVQHYGYKYDYRARKIDSSFSLGELPSWLDVLSKRLAEDAYFDTKSDQVIVNEYLPGQGISPHIDCEPCFGDVIASLSLVSGATMQFAKDGEKQNIYLEPRSLVVLKDDARYHWMHSIPARKSDKIYSEVIPRARRVSLTFRNVIIT